LEKLQIGDKTKTILEVKKVLTKRNLMLLFEGVPSYGEWRQKIFQQAKGRQSKGTSGFASIK